MTHSQTFRVPCWTAAKWLCLSFWGNSLLSLMLTVAIGYWGLAHFLGWVGRGAWLDMGWGWQLSWKCWWSHVRRFCICMSLSKVKFSSWVCDSWRYACAYDYVCATKWLCTCSDFALVLVLHDRTQVWVYWNWCIGGGLLCFSQHCLLILSPYWHKWASREGEQIVGKL